MFAGRFCSASDHGATANTRLLELIKHPEERKARSACDDKRVDEPSMVYGDAHGHRQNYDGCEASAGLVSGSTAQPSPNHDIATIL